MSLSVSKKASLLVLPASMAAVEALKDQAGLRRWDYVLRSLYQRAVVTDRRAAPASLSSQAGSGSSSVTCCSTAAGVAKAARPRRSEEEKLHKAYHIVCWGSN